MAPGGTSGRFINEDVIRMDVRHGRPTSAGQPLDIPLSQPAASYLLLAAQLLVYSLGTTLAVTKGAPAADDLFMTLALDPVALVGAGDAGEWWRLGSATFVHASMLHLTLNCWALGFVGAEAEALLGSGAFLFAYLFSGATGSVAALALEGGQSSVAASAAVFGLLGAMMGVKLQNRRSLPSRQQSQVWAFLGICLANMLIASAPGGEAVTNAGHLGGFVGGLASGLALGPQFQVVRELDIPEGSMVVDEDARELCVVVDKRGGLQRVAAGGALVAGLAAAALAAAHLASSALGAAGVAP